MTTKKKEIKKAPAGNKPHGAATAAAILGLGSAPEVKAKKNGEAHIKPEWQKFYNRLLELRDQLLRQMNGL
ncbi:MAG TPA: transcriptional regulator, partial [Bacillota bacterium]|nr:transcriptional regulator [Bacillota bacterium]